MTKVSQSTHFKDHPYILAFLTSCLLILCFPAPSTGFLGWIALIPLLYSLRHARSESQALLAGYLAGFMFFLISAHWFTYVHFAAWTATALFEAVFFMLFAWFVYHANGFRSRLLRIVWIAAAWLTVEILRAEIPVMGFGWNLLAYSQSDYLPLIQSASLVGAYGLGFLMALVNACVAEMIGEVETVEVCVRTAPDRASAAKCSDARFKAGLTLMAVLVVMLVAVPILHGQRRLAKSDRESPSIRISLIQGNIPQELKWNSDIRDKILDTYLKLTEIAQYDQPDIAIWPEAAFPGYFNQDENADKVHDLGHRLQLPMLIGSCHLEGIDAAYNSAYLLDGMGTMIDRYDKPYLVPFGEYVPFHPRLGWLEPVARDLGVSDFYAGNRPGVFQMPNQKFFFSSLICFEDIFPNLAREAVDQGAEWLAVITNDAWFGPTAAAHQHLQASVFRALENGVPVVRAANTGISGFISAKGEVFDRVTGRNGKDIFVTGTKTATVYLPGGTTFYRRAGWIFPYTVALIFLVTLLGWKTRGFIREKRNIPSA